MAVLLAGGCRVADGPENAPQVGGELISMRVVEVEPGKSVEFRNEDLDEVVFSLGGFTAAIEGVGHRVDAESGGLFSAHTHFPFFARLATHPVARLDPAGSRAGPLPQIRRVAFYFARRRPHVGRRQIDADW